MRIGVDIGGTFTDFVFHDADSAQVTMWKTPTTSPDPSDGVINGLKTVLGDAPDVLQTVAQIVHGTTIGANTIIERTGAKTLLITTRGFRDVLEIQRQRRPNLYDMFQDKPPPLVPRNQIREATERLAFDGKALLPLDEDEVRELADLVRTQGFESVAVSFLHAYANPTHEQAVRRIISEQLNGTPISLSSEISPKYREYERTNTTVANAYISPRVQQYLRRLRGELEGLGYGAPFFVMQSNGGITTAEVAEQVPVRVIESGPAAGVIAAAHMAGAAGLGDVISFDMGGTTAKISLIEKGVPASTDEFEIDRHNLIPESGLPLSIPAIDLIEMGAGGGSIARASLGTIVVGPESAGADPGPVCYGRQGQLPAVTDADLVLGYLNPDYFLGGEMKLDSDGARRALAELGQQVGLSGEQTAWGVHEIVNTNMALAMREATIRRGYDPRESTMVAFGGAGPMHACRLAKELGIPRVLIPLNAGVNSALGLLIAGARFDLVQTFVTMLDQLTGDVLEGIYQNMRRMAEGLLQASHGASPTFLRSADMRYSGQGYEVTVPLPDEVEGPSIVEQMRANFETTYRERYGFLNPGAPIEVVNWRMLALGESPQISLERREGEQPLGVSAAATVPRPAYFPEHQGWVECAVYDWYSLSDGDEIEGPAIVEARETSALVLPGDRASVDSFGNLLLHLN